MPLPKPAITSRAEDFALHDLSAESSQFLAGLHTPTGARLMVDIAGSFSIMGMSRGAFFFYLGQPDEPGARLYDSGGKPLPGVECHSVASISGESAWAGTAYRRLFFDVEPGKPVTWQMLGAIIGGAATVPVAPGPTRIAITPDGTRAFVVSPRSNAVTPVVLGRPGHSYDQRVTPMDEPQPPVSVDGPLDVACDDEAVAVLRDGGVTVLSARTFDVAREVDLPGAAAVAVGPASRVVAVADDGRLIVIDRPGQETATDVGGQPCGLAVVGNYAFVADRDERAVHRVDLLAHRVVAAIPLDDEPAVIRASPDGRVWVAGRPRSLVRIDLAANAVAERFELPYEEPNDLAFVPVKGQTEEVVRTAWLTYSGSRYSQFQIAGAFAGQTHSYHNGVLEGEGGTTGVALNDYGEIWVVQSELDRLWKWPGGRLFIRPGVFFGEYCDVSVYDEDGAGL